MANKRILVTTNRIDNVRALDENAVIEHDIPTSRLKGPYINDLHVK